MREFRIAAGVLALLALPAWAQSSVSTPAVVPTPSELARQRDPRLPTDAGPGAEARTPPRELGKLDDELKLDVDAYVLDADAPEALRAALPRLTAPYAGKGRSYEDLVLAANELTRFMQSELGYYLGYAYIPEQDPASGTVRIAVLEGRLDRVQLNWSEGLPVRREVLQAYLDRLQPGSVLTVREVERVVFLLNDLRGILVRAEVKPGTRPGTAILEFTPKADPRLSYKIDGDLNGSRFIGAERLGASVMWNSPLGRGDGLSVSALGSVSGGLRFGLLGYSTPLGADGIKAGVSVSALRYELDKGEFPLGLDGDGLTINAFALYPWVRSRNLNLFLLGALDSKRYEDRISSLSNRKRVDDLVLGMTGDFRDSLLRGGVNTFELNYSAGRLRFPDGRPSGLDDAASFGKISYAFSRLQNILDGRLLAYLSLRGQQALHNLDTTEQFRAGGPDGVRAFGPGEGTGDSGTVLTAELRWLPPEAWFGRWARELVLGVFADAALVQLRHDPSLINRDESYDNQASFAGVGLSLVWARPGAYGLRLSVATPTTGIAKSETRPRDPRLYLQGSWFF
jgi:hemolysin activation/secretion protein